MPHNRLRDRLRGSAGERQLRRADERTLASRALDLQQLVGNSAVTALIARAPLQRDAKPKPPAQKEERGGSGYTLTIDGIGTTRVESLSFGSTHTGTVGTGAGGGKKQGAPQDVVFTVKTDKFSVKVMEYAATGRAITQAIVVSTKGGATHRMVLKDVRVASFQSVGGHGEPLDSFTLTAAEVEHEFDEKAGAAAPGAGQKAGAASGAGSDY